MSYVRDRIQYEELLIKTIKEAQKQNSLISTLENGQGHCSIHMLKPGQDERDRTEKQYKIGTYFYSEQEQTKAINKIFEQRISDIVDWAFGSVDKKCELEITFDKPIGVGIDLRLNKYNIKKAKLVLTRDEMQDTRFVLTTLFPAYDKDATFVKALERRTSEPRLLSFFEELRNDKNKKFYSATMRQEKDKTIIQLKSLINKKAYTIILNEDSNTPVFSLDDRIDHYRQDISESEFGKMEPNILAMFNKHREWEKQDPPIKPVVKEKRLSFFEKYCLNNNLSYEKFSADEERLKSAKMLLNHNISPELAIREDITPEILSVIMKQISKNEKAGYLYNGQVTSEVDIMHYIGEKCVYTADQLNTLFFVASNGIDTTLIENPIYSPEQMNMIKSGINFAANHPEQKIDLRKILNPKFSPEEIRKRLNDEINRTRKQNSYNSYNKYGRY